ncbi:MAG: YciK family oxidoreductase [Gammaproteobacteria bacterium]|nr:YciK family oxidoreductase [Gammaproteobacteria bacterium]
MLDYKPDDDLLKDRVILVTGVGDGIGRAAAVSFARYGASVIGLGHTASELASLRDDISAQGAHASSIVIQDLAKFTEGGCKQLAEEIDAEFGQLDGLLNNAAELGILSPLHLYDLDTWSRVMRVNLYIPYLLTRACLPLLKKSEDASVIFTSADVARRGRAYWGAYAVAGSGIEALMRIWADELETNTNVRVNTLDPGPVRTGFQHRAYPGKDTSELLTADDVMPAYLYLIGPDSRGVSGQAFSAQILEDSLDV